MPDYDEVSRGIVARCCTIIDLLIDELERSKGCNDAEWSELKNAIQRARECRKHCSNYVHLSLTAIVYYEN